MAQKYNLQPNEVVLLKEQGVGRGAKSSSTDELTLTNLNLVLLNKGMFGNSKGIVTFPVTQIKVSNDRAQVLALMGEAGNGTPVLQVHLRNGLETFRFRSSGKKRLDQKKLNEWATAINRVVTGQELPPQELPGTALPGAELVAGVLKDTVSVFKSKFASKPDAPVKVAGRCRACGAPVAGHRGQTFTCDYCNSAQQL